MSAKTTYIATAPDGTEFTRTTTRTYTHAVLVHATKSWNNPNPHWGQIGFCGREDLAVKEAAKWPTNVEFGDGAVFTQVVIVPVHAK